MQTRERLIINDEGADLLREVVTREAAPSTELAEWRGTGPDRGAWEEAQVEVEYIAPGRTA